MPGTHQWIEMSQIHSFVQCSTQPLHLPRRRHTKHDIWPPTSQVPRSQIRNRTRAWKQPTLRCRPFPEKIATTAPPADKPSTLPIISSRFLFAASSATVASPAVASPPPPPRTREPNRRRRREHRCPGFSGAGRLSVGSSRPCPRRIRRSRPKCRHRAPLRGLFFCSRRGGEEGVLRHFFISGLLARCPTSSKQTWPADRTTFTPFVGLL